MGILTNLVKNGASAFRSRLPTSAGGAYSLSPNGVSVPRIGVPSPQVSQGAGQVNALVQTAVAGTNRLGQPTT